MFDEILEFVNTPQFAIDAVDLSLAFDFSLANSCEELLFFMADMIAEMQSI